ncbi:MAG: hypothetical protein ACE5IL_13755 [Myxococcota bacterium]
MAPLGPPNPGAPEYIPNTLNGRQDALTNPGSGATADPSAIHNTSSVGPAAIPPGTFLFNTQVGGFNPNCGVCGPFGSGAAVITGPQFGFALSDGGIRGGRAPC